MKNTIKINLQNKNQIKLQIGYLISEAVTTVMRSITEMIILRCLVSCIKTWRCEASSNHKVARVRYFSLTFLNMWTKIRARRMFNTVKNLRWMIGLLHMNTVRLLRFTKAVSEIMLYKAASHSEILNINQRNL